ncbi:MAG: YbjN domain-containing protein [Rhodocyclaceae bacterium]|nr:YbjN domain-containing protein [Rhodocyclaceae bacterium]MBX3666859.1 YbjN domain-containing protein [Rhodocyclaceae bacterium]
MNPPSNMFQTIGEYLAEADWHFDSDPDGTLFAGSVTGDHCTWQVLITIDDDPEVRRVTVESRLPAKVPAPRRLAAAEALARLNYEFAAGSFVLNMRDGNISFRSSVDLVDAELTSAMFERLLNLSVSLTDEYFPVIMSVIYGGEDASTVTVTRHAGQPEGEALQ